MKGELFVNLRALVDNIFYFDSEKISFRGIWLAYVMTIESKLLYSYEERDELYIYESASLSL